MAAVDLTAQALAWAADEIGKQCLGEEFGVSVTWAPTQAMSPQGPRLIPAWFVLVTARNPVLGEGPLFHGPITVGSPVPEEQAVRATVTDGLRQLRDLAKSKLAGGNGHAPAPPAGLAKGHR
jgi:hypothetical protein